MEIEINNNSLFKFSESGIKKRNFELWENIINYIEEDLPFKQKFYLYNRNLKNVPKCYCGG
jgi:hypothetical protein